MAESILRSRNVMAGRIRTHYTECGDNGPRSCYVMVADRALRAKPASAS